MAILVEWTAAAPSTHTVSTSSQTAQQFLLAFPRGAYTGMRTLEHYSVIAWKHHMSRLADSLRGVPHGEDSGVVPADEPAEVRQEMQRVRDAEQLERICSNLVHVGLHAHYQQEQGLQDEAKVVVLGWYSFATKKACLAVHIGPLNAKGLQQCTVEIHGSPRQSPTYKDSQWVRERERIVASMHADSEEALLAQGDCLYEGLTSNFFAVVLPAQRPVVVAAPADAVLDGTVQRLVLTACEQLGIEVRREFPRWSQASSWLGCSLTSTSRLVLPISRLVHHETGQEITMPATCDAIRAIQLQVLKLSQERAVRVCTCAVSN